MNANLIFVANLVATWYMVGLIWMVQIVHYKLFDRVGPDGFAIYEAAHSRLITSIVGLPMLVELATACLLLSIAPEGFPRGAAIAGVAMVVAIWLSTALLQVPMHSRLSNGFDTAAYHSLVTTNWIRTILWTARGAMMAYFLTRLMRA